MPVSLILPCYAPQPGWEQIVRSGAEAFRQVIGEQMELILVLDGRSDTVTDATLQWLKDNLPYLQVIQYDENMGKGYAIRQGVTAAGGDIIMYTDIDLPYTLASMEAVYRRLHNNECDIAAGVKDEAYYSHVPAMRRIISRGLRFFTRSLLSMPITDTQCGLKGFRRSAAEVFLSTTINRYLFDLEFIYKGCCDKRYRVMAIPVTLRDNITFRRMNYRILLPEMADFMKLLLNRPR
ncbi:glycosyltransferase [Nemorincola caseinilytica]